MSVVAAILEKDEHDLEGNLAALELAVFVIHAGSASRYFLDRRERSSKARYSAIRLGML